MEQKKEQWVTLSDQSVSGLITLQTIKSSERLNQIDRVRAKGVGDHISLPQLVVCGDQSAGKSSVLEGITGIPFPRAEGMCTRFATEIILRHQPNENRITARLLPSVLRTEKERLRMDSFKRQLDSFDELPDIIQEASTLMEIRGTTNSGPNSPAFAADVLSLEFVGNTGLHLTVVDLPGLILVSENEQDMRIVEDLVDDYLKSSRTIILAVVQASNDIDTQGIIQRARKFDKAGERTVGIITKPDLINKGTETRVASLARNVERTKLRLGFFLLKNPTPVQLRECISWKERTKQETQFFNSSPWSEQNLDKCRVGIEKLRYFLQELLDSHIERELPKVRKEVQALLLNTEQQLAQIGPERSSVAQIRMFLMHISMDIYNLTKAALDGSYSGRDGAFFLLETNSIVRLRAKVHIENESFAAFMRENGAKRKTGHCHHAGEAERSTDSDESWKSNSSAEEGQLQVTRKEMLKWVETVYHSTRGRELPGNYNHTLLSELFHEQCSQWGDIANKHLQTTVSLINRFVRSVLSHVVADDQVRSGIQNRIQQTLNQNFQNARQELNKIILEERGSPITYNHYYTDNIQKAHEDAAKKKLQDSMEHAIKNDWSGKFHVSNTLCDLERVCSSLKSRVIVDMTQQACIESLAALNAYYKVAMKTFVDNVCRQVIERHLLNGLTKAFDPICVSQLSDDDVRKIASETVQVRNRRIELQGLKLALDESLCELQS